MYTLSFVTQKESSFGYESSHIHRGRVSIGHFCDRGSVFFFRDVVRTYVFFFFTFFIDTLFLLCDSKLCTYDVI